MKKYNALDNVRAAAELSIQLRLEADDLSAALDYEIAVDHLSIEEFAERDSGLVKLRTLAAMLAEYAGTEAVAEVLNASR